MNETESWRHCFREILVLSPELTLGDQFHLVHAPGIIPSGGRGGAGDRLVNGAVDWIGSEWIETQFLTSSDGGSYFDVGCSALCRGAVFV